MPVVPREGEYMYVLGMDDVRANVRPKKNAPAFAPLSKHIDSASVLTRDLEGEKRLENQELKEEILDLITESIGESRRPDASTVRRRRYYKEEPNVEAYLAEDGELGRLAAAPHNLELTVNSAFPVGLWYHDKCDGTCVFCYEQLMGPCYHCLAGERDIKKCQITIGECGHPIHADCQRSWSGSASCMTCQQKWVVKTTLPFYGHSPLRSDDARF